MTTKANKKLKKKNEKSQNSTVSQHHRQGKTLTPPLAKLPALQKASWRDDRLPEVLWVALLVSHLERESALNVIRQLADEISKLPKLEGDFDITHTGIAKLAPEPRLKLLRTIVSSIESRRVLACLLLLNELPAKESWKIALEGETPSPSDWTFLMVAVAKTLFHQSQEATDCRWTKVICKMAAGILMLPTEEMVKEFFYYPHYGDLRKVRPSIRATEGAFSNIIEESDREWPGKFWAQCLADMQCFTLPSNSNSILPLVGTTIDHLRITYENLLNHFHRTIVDSAVNPKHDAVFGFGFYALSILRELLSVGASLSITARLGLRTLVECYITFAYLVQKSDSELWRTYRIFGAGQAKLQYLKLEELESDSTYVSIEGLKELANEDMWEEFLQIDLGHWNNSDLRNMSIACGAKDEYDKFYGWTSSFAHGHWGAVRDSVYDTCGNPLHRLHRIPRQSTRSLPDIIPDACVIVDKILELIDKCYPIFADRITITKE